MDHQKVRDNLTDYLLGELDVAEHDAIRAHLASCPECAAEEAKVRTLLTTVEQALRMDIRAPEDFADRVMNRIPAREFTTTPVHRRFFTPLAAVAAALVIFAFVFHFRKLPAVTSPSITATEATLTPAVMMAFHQQIASGASSMPLASVDPGAEATSLSERAGYALIPVTINDANVHVAGANVSTLMGKPVAVWKLMLHGKPMTLMQMGQNQARLPKLVPMPFPAQNRLLLCGATGDCQYVAWHQKNMTFVLVANMPEKDVDRTALEINV